MILSFQSGTLVLSGISNQLPERISTLFSFDPRTGCLTSEAYKYPQIIIALLKENYTFTDEAKAYGNIDINFKKFLTLYPHQQESLNAWISAGKRGVAVLPTGSGKTILAVAAIEKTGRPAIILVPTIDLLTQWSNTLERFFDEPIGMLGGGCHDIRNITVSTYDSAVLNMEFIGNRFGLLIADECHHLPSKEYQLAAKMCIAPFRLGLTATPEMTPERLNILNMLSGDIVSRHHIDEFAGSVLSPYIVKTVKIRLSDTELVRYKNARNCYINFIRRKGISFDSPDGWKNFMILSSRSDEGRKAFNAFLEQREIARGAKEKIRYLQNILREHNNERIIIFTADNATAYDIGRKYILPVLTHLTKPAERKEFLQLFRDGTCNTLVTSQVLNEGVDVPEASVGVILSGSGSVREHVQRLGRILRSSPGKKQAVLYEIISGETAEEQVSMRRRDHRAYRRRRNF